MSSLPPPLPPPQPIPKKGMSGCAIAAIIVGSLIGLLIVGVLAKEKVFSPIPKIIYTTHVNGAQKEAQALAEPLLLVSKQDHRSELVEAVRTTLNLTPTNWELQFDFGPAARLTFQNLANTISLTRSNNAEMEITDLL